jgi:hypothetical protein
MVQLPSTPAPPFGCRVRSKLHVSDSRTGTSPPQVGTIMRRSLLVFLVLLGITRAPAQAQTCLGLAPFSSSAVQVTGEGAFTQSSNGVSAGLGYGLPASLFGGVTVGTRSFEAFDGSSVDLGAAAGYQISVARAAGFELCPLASFNLGIGPNSRFGSGVDRSSRLASIGLALG